jgi:hypothetical protein
MAARIAVNRTVAGLHYPSDSAAGAALGLAVAGWLVARATGDAAPRIGFDGHRWGEDAPGGSKDFHLPAFIRAWEGQTCLTHAVAGELAKAELVAAVWESAQQEWSDKWG